MEMQLEQAQEIIDRHFAGEMVYEQDYIDALEVKLGHIEEVLERVQTQS